MRKQRAKLEKPSLQDSLMGRSKGASTVGDRYLRDLDHRALAKFAPTHLWQFVRIEPARAFRRCSSQAGRRTPMPIMSL